MAELRVSGMGLKTRFVITMTAALTLVMAIGGWMLYGAATRIAETVQNDVLSAGVRLAMDEPEWKTIEGRAVKEHRSGVQIFPVRYGDPPHEGLVYRLLRIDKQTAEESEYRLLVPSGTEVGRALLGLIAAIMAAIVLVGAGVALWVANQVSRPITDIIEDVRQIAKGDLGHKTRVRGGGEVELLARSIDRMTRELDGAQEARVELSVRERELDLAAGVREALLPLATPSVLGYDLGAAHVPAGEFGGDFHDFVELADDRVGLLVCDVSGQGVPAALVGATARSYMKSELSRGEDVAASFGRINRWLARDVRRGMFVTALYVLIEPKAARATVACAGHKIPLLRYGAADGKLRVVHPEGIALGFDKGPVFEKRLAVEVIELQDGDRLVLANSAPVAITNAEGRELGEKAFYSRIFKHAALDTQAFLKAVKADLRQFAGDGGITQDLSLVTIARVDRS